MTITEFIEALTIMSKHMINGMDSVYFMGAEHDIIYFYVDNVSLPEDSEDAKRLIELGFFVSNSDNWAKYT